MGEDRTNVGSFRENEKQPELGRRNISMVRRVTISLAADSKE